VPTKRSKPQQPQTQKPQIEACRRFRQAVLRRDRKQILYNRHPTNQPIKSFLSNNLTFKLLTKFSKPQQPQTQKPQTNHPFPKNIEIFKVSTKFSKSVIHPFNHPPNQKKSPEANHEAFVN